MLSGFFFCPLLSFPSSVLLQRSRCTPHLALTRCSCHRGSDSLKGHKIELRRSRQKATERSAEEYWDSKALRPALRPGSSGMGCLSRTVRLVCLQPSCVGFLLPACYNVLGRCFPGLGLMSPSCLHINLFYPPFPVLCIYLCIFLAPLPLPLSPLQINRLFLSPTKLVFHEAFHTQVSPEAEASLSSTACA